MAAAGYLLINDVFVALWLGKDYQISHVVQFAFVANLVLTAGTDALQRVVCLRSLDDLHYYSRSAVVAGVVYLIVAFASMKTGYIIGIASAAALAQLVFGILSARRLCAEPGWVLWAIVRRVILLPLAVLSLLIALRLFTYGSSLVSQACLVAAYLGILAFTARLLGFRPADLPHEIKTLMTLLRRNPNPES